MGELQLENDRLTELVITIKSELAVLNAQSKATLESISKALESIANHENRLTKLEVQDKLEVQEKAGGFKSDILALAVKGLVISICALGTLAGAGTIIAKALGH